MKIARTFFFASLTVAILSPPALADVGGKRQKEMERTQRESGVSYLVVDLDGDGVELTSLWSAQAVWWDIDLDGFKEATAWVAPDDGLLAIDRNGNGLIDGQGELFGDERRSGFEALAEFDSNRDGRIDSQDPVWDRLLIWREKRIDGYSAKGELFPVKGSNILRFNLDPFPLNQLTADNKVTARGSYDISYAGIEGVETRNHPVENVQASYSDTNTVYRENYPLDFRVLYLPTLRGYGTLPNLHVAMSLDKKEDGSLLDQVRALDVPLEELFNPDRDIEHDVDHILFRWANVDTLDPGSRGPHIDARKLGYLEMMIGQPFVQSGALNAVNPLFFAAIDLNEAYQIAYNNAFARLIAQTPGKGLFTGNPHYNPVRDEIEGIRGLNHKTLANIKALTGATSDMAKRRTIWRAVVRTIAFTVGLEGLSGEDRAVLDDLVQKSLNGAGVDDLYREMTIYQPETSYWPYVITDRLYKYFGIRLNSNWPIIAVVLGGLGLLFGDAYRKRNKNMSV